MIILGIETSCDDTALALIETRGEGSTLECRVISSLVHSQADLHSAYGGVFPSLAKREHGKNLVPLLHKLLIQSTDALETLSGPFREISLTKFETILEPFRTSLQGSNPDLIASMAHAEFLTKIPHIDRIAVTEGPGLEPALWVGISFARMLSSLWNIPLTAVNHMEGHIVGSLLESDTAFGTWQSLKPLHTPALALLISGGHTELVNIHKLGTYTIIGQTKDDAVGEAFDKVARLLELGYPGGPHIARLAEEALQEKIPSPVQLPRPMIHSADLDFSFSGLKTAVLYTIREAPRDADGHLTDSFKKGLAYEFERSVTETLETKVRKALEHTGAHTLIIGGGVSANHVLRKCFTHIADEYAIPLYMPTRHISGDNALMIALAGALDTTLHTRALKADGTKTL